MVFDEVPEGMREIEASEIDRAMHKFVEFLVEDKSIPDDVKRIFWAPSDKEAALTNLQEGDVGRIMNLFDITALYYMMSKPFWDHSFDDDFAMEQLRFKLFLKLKRSVRGFERRMEATQIRQMIYEEPTQASGGIVSRFSGGMRRMFGMGRRR